MADMKEISKWLVIIGGIVGLIQAILFFVPGIGFSFYAGIWAGDATLGLVGAIIAIILSLIALATSGVVEIKALKLNYNFIVLLILGILMAIFGSDLGGILVIIGAILLLLK